MASFESKLEAFLENYEKMKAVENEEAFLKEFIRLKGQSAQYKEQNTYPAESGQLTINRRKNRFKDIIPFEYTRVSLHAIEGVEGSDYVNANYIQGADGSVTYIAAQGPLPHTVGDFWRMLWYHNIEIVVMACKLVEMAKPKCECYWPPLNETISYGPITVRTIHEEEISKEFIIRDFVAECDGEKQKIRQYHFSSWPDHGRPGKPQPVLNMIDALHNYRSRLDVPILVHCSAGCGRTGTIIAIDMARAMILNRHIPEEFNPYTIVEGMRKQRPAMVQAKEQYVFVYMAMSQMSASALNKAPEGERGEDDASNYENCTPSNTPVPLPRTNSSKAPSATAKADEGGGESQPVAPPRVNKPYENILASSSSSSSSSSSLLGQRNGGRPSPPQPKPRTSNGPPETSSTRPTPPPKPSKPSEEQAESHYSMVDMSQLRDKGPEISVVSEEGRSAPLSTVEEKLDRHGGAANASRSIFETIMSEVGDLLPDKNETDQPSPPPPLPPANPVAPPTTANWTEFEDEIPPPIPLHTEASTHILEPPTTSSDSDHVVIDSGIYYAPTPHSIPMPGGASPPSARTNTSPTRTFTSVTPSTPPHSSATLPVTATSSTNSASTTGKGSRLKIFKGIGKSKSEKKKPLTASDIGRPTGIPRSPSDHGISSPPRGQSPSPDHGVPSLPLVNKSLLSDLGPPQSEPANNRYTFPGEMGFGHRIPRPRGPRPEPPHWNVIRNSITAA